MRRRPKDGTVNVNWSFPTQVRFGAGRIAELAEACASVGIARPLLVTDPMLAAMPMVESAAARLCEAGLAVATFSDIKSNPVESDVAAGLAALRRGTHDGVIAFGGGSALDVGKVIAFMAAQSRPMWNFEDVGDQWRRANADGILPVIAVPTTAGTGSEVGRAGVITQLASRTKKVIFHPKMMPAVAICDPELTVGLPPKLTAATGLDAFVHCLEAYCAPGFHPLADGIAVEGMRLVKENLRRAFAHGDDLVARGNMMAAAAMGATAFQKGLGGVHAIAHAVGALYDTHHGLANGVLVPYVLRYNRPVVADRIVRLARWLDLKPEFDAFLDWLLALREALGVPHRLADLGITRADSAKIAAIAAADPCAAGNPRPFDASVARNVFEAAVVGTLG
jgi:alcohol dehydrogenase